MLTAQLFKDLCLPCILLSLSFFLSSSALISVMKWNSVGYVNKMSIYFAAMLLIVKYVIIPKLSGCMQICAGAKQYISINTNTVTINYCSNVMMS